MITRDELSAFIASPAVDPDPFYRSLRERGPLRDPDGNWVIARWADASLILRTNKWMRGDHHVRDSEQGSEAVSPFHRLFGEFLTHKPSADHTRLRGLVLQAFTPTAIARLTDRIQDATDAYLAPTDGQGQMEVISSLAYPLPPAMICSLLDISGAHEVDLARWSADISRYLDVSADAAAVRAGEDAAAEFIAFMEEIIRTRRRTPGDDVLSGLVEARDADDRLSEDELVSICCELLLAGHETTTNLIGNGLLALVTHRDAWDALCEDPSLAEAAVEECLRFDPPIRCAIPRIVTEDIDLGDTVLRTGDRIAIWIGAANRDEHVFSDPEAFDIRRSPNKHLSFAAGAHFCLGASLARLQGRVVFETLARRRPTLRLAEPLPHAKPFFFLHSLAELNVEWSGADRD